MKGASPKGAWWWHRTGFRDPWFWLSMIVAVACSTVAPRDWSAWKLGVTGLLISLTSTLIGKSLTDRAKAAQRASHPEAPREG